MFSIFQYHISGKSSGIATGGARGAECHPWQRKNCQKSGKSGGKSGKIRKKRGEIGKKRQKSVRFFSLCPSWQIGLVMLLGKRGRLKTKITYNYRASSNFWIASSRFVTFKELWFLNCMMFWILPRLQRFPSSPLVYVNKARNRVTI